MIVLIIPPSPFLINERVFPSLGVLKVAAALREAGKEVEVWDFSGNRAVYNSDDKLRKITHFGVSITTPQLPSVVKLVTHLKGYYPRVPIIAGGPHVTLVNSAHKRGSQRVRAEMATLLDTFDSLVAGDGERAVFSALRGISNLIDADSPKSSYFTEPDDQPLPARDLIDLDSYRYEIDKVKTTSIITQLGCPFGCRFCGGRSSPSFRRLRARSIDSIEEEVKHLMGLGYRGVMFYDDELNVNHNHLVQLMQRLQPYQLRMRGFVRADLFNETQAKVMYDAGFREVAMGFESGSDKILKNIGKGTVEGNTGAVEMAHDAGLRVKALMSIGHPGESISTVHATQQWLLDVKPDDFDLTIITPYPGSVYYDEAQPILGGKWKYEIKGSILIMDDIDYSVAQYFYKGDPRRGVLQERNDDGDEGYKSYVSTPHLSNQELVFLRSTVDRYIREELGIPCPK